ncbi:MAG TPA: glycosyltransferase family 2 protein [Actinopolymorphaceae bacterium]
MSDHRPRLAVIVVNYGSHELLEENLRPVGASELAPIVVVVDNPTGASERDAVVEQAATYGWTLVEPAVNLGFGAGMNAGVTRAVELGADTFLLLNPDATIDVASIELLLARVADEPMTLVAPVVARPDGEIWSAGVDLYLDSGQMWGTARRPAGARVMFWLSGACLMVSRTLWERLGGFADGYFLYWEDVDLSRRVVDAGGALAVEPGARAVHSQGGTQEVGHGRGRSATYYYYNTRNRLLYAARHLDARDRRRWAWSAGPAAWEILMRGGRRQLLRPRAPVGAVLRGTADGLRLMRSEPSGRG